MTLGLTLLGFEMITGKELVFKTQKYHMNGFSMA